jgi:hypothetical protein
VRRVGTVILLVSGLAAAFAGEGERNLVGNGDFNEGRGTASEIPGWTEVDGLTTFFEVATGRGRVLKIDTDVNISEANERWREMAKPKAERAKAKKKGPTKEPKYDTVGGLNGAKIFSDYIRVEAGMRYRLKVDVKSNAPTVKIFVKGYAKFEGGFRKFYQCYKNVKPATGQWKTWERTFNPTIRSAKVTHIRIMPYAYWPPGQAWIDNVEVTRVGKDDPAALVPGKNLLANGDFEGKKLEPWAGEGDAGLLRRGSAGGCGRVAGEGTLVSGAVPVREKREYVLKARVRSEKAVVTATVEGLVVLGGKRHVLFTKADTVTKGDGEWNDLEIPFHPTEETPQVAEIRVRFTLEGGKGSAFIDDVTIEARPGGKKPPE